MLRRTCAPTLAALLLILSSSKAFGMQPLRHQFVQSEKPFLVHGPSTGWAMLIGGLSMFAAGLASKDTWSEQSLGQKIGTSTLITFGSSFILISPFIRFEQRRFVGASEHSLKYGESLTNIDQAEAVLARDQSAAQANLIMAGAISTIGLLSSESSEDREIIATMAAIPLAVAAYNYYVFRTQREILQSAKPNLQSSLMINSGHIVPALALHMQW